MRLVYLATLAVVALMGVACSESEKEAIKDSPVSAIAGEDLADEPRAAAPQVQIAEGQIMSIDAERKLLWMKLRNGGDEGLFRYTPNTRVEGFGDLTEGLADKFSVDDLQDVAKGSTVRVHYRSDADVVVPYNAALNTVVKIELDRP